MDAYLPPVRCPQDMKERLQIIAGNSVTSDLSPHMRAAIDGYIKANWTPEMESEFQARKVDSSEEASS
jgi:predicted transcriptional regulator